MRRASEVEIPVFTYWAELDAFVVTSEYAWVARELDLDEWNPVVWIGRLFSMDNDLGEHWLDFDQWDLEQQIRAAGREPLEVLFIKPDKMQDGRNGPVHTPRERLFFWAAVMRSLRLDLRLMIFHARCTYARMEQIRRVRNLSDAEFVRRFDPIDLEAGIQRVLHRYAAVLDDVPFDPAIVEAVLAPRTRPGPHR